MQGSNDHPERQRRIPRSDVRRRVLDAARREFAAQGFDGVSLDQIAAAAGFSKGAVYSNFATKHELFLALMDESVGLRLDAAREVRGDASVQSVAEIAQRLGDRLVAQFAGDADWQVLFLEFWMRAVRDPEVRGPFVEYRRRFRAQVAAEFERVLPQGDAELSSLEIATTILALVNGLAIERLADPESVGGETLGTLLGRVIRAQDDVGQVP